MKKKLLLTICTATAALLCGMGLVACGETPECDEHTWNNGKEITAPTCSQKGSAEYECTVCHKKETREISATGVHHYDTFVEYIDAPTCITAGTATYKCTTCDDTTTKDVDATGDHSSTLKWEYEGNLHWQECTVENCTYATDKVEHGEEDWTETDREDADCTNNGYVDYECVCGATKSETLNATGIHHYDILVAYIDEPTCGEGGSATYKCTTCEETTVKDVGPTGNHDYQAQYNDTQHYQKCSVCQDEIEHEDHHIDYVIDEQATLYATGRRHEACTDCEYSKENYESYELDGFVSDYRDGVRGTAEGWEFGKADYSFPDNPDNFTYPANDSGSESFNFTAGTYNNNANDPAWTGKDGAEVKASGWINANWVSMKYTVGAGVENATYTVALHFKYNPNEAHAGHYTQAVIRIVVLDKDNQFKQGYFIGDGRLNGAGDGSSVEQEISGLNTGDQVFFLIEFATEGNSWTQGDLICRLFEKKDEA